MVRTIITIDEEEKRWLESYSKIHRQSLAETIRCAVNEFKKRKAKDKGHYLKVLDASFGIWKNRKIDSVEYQRKLRAQWNRDL